MLGAENAVGVDANGRGCERLWLLEVVVARDYEGDFRC